MPSKPPKLRAPLKRGTGRQAIPYTSAFGLDFASAIIVNRPLPVALVSRLCVPPHRETQPLGCLENGLGTPATLFYDRFKIHGFSQLDQLTIRSP